MPNLDHPGGKMREMSKQFWIKSVRNLNLDHPGGIDLLISPQMVKIQLKFLQNFSFNF